MRASVGFLVDDIRMVGRSDAAQALWVWLEATALHADVKREFLPAAFDAEEIAARRRRTLEETRAALEELSLPLKGTMPLIGFLRDGRIRVTGVRSKHGDKITWRDEDSEFGAWGAEHGPDKWFPAALLLSSGSSPGRGDTTPASCPHDAADKAHNAGDRGHDATRTAADPELESESEPPPTPPGQGEPDSGLAHPCAEAATTTAPPSVQRPPELCLLHDITDGWPATGKAKVLPDLLRRLQVEPVRTLAFAHGVEREWARHSQPGARMRSPWLCVRSRLTKGYEPSEKLDYYPVKARLEGLRRSGEAEGVGRVAHALAQAFSADRPGDPRAMGRGSFPGAGGAAGK